MKVQFSKSRKRTLWTKNPTNPGWLEPIDLSKVVHLDADWAMQVTNWSSDACSVKLLHTPCFTKLTAQFPALIWPHGGSVNKKSVSCYYCKARNKGEVREKIRFLLNEEAEVKEEPVVTSALSGNGAIVKGSGPTLWPSGPFLADWLSML